MSPLVRKKSRALTRPRSSTHARAHGHTIVLLDIGSSSVGAALLELNPGEKPTLLAHKRASLRIAPDRRARDLEPQLLAASTEALAALRAAASDHAIRNIAVFLPAPWSELSLHKVRFAQDRSFLASSMLMNQMIAAHVKDEERLLGAMTGSSMAGIASRVFERVVAGLRLNGYVSPAMIDGTEVFTIEMMLASSSAPMHFLDRLAQIAREKFPRAELTMHSSILSAAHALSRFSPESHTFMVCDGEGELAELLVVRETIPEAHATIPVGYATILRTLAMHGGFSHAELPAVLALMGDPRSPLAHSAAEAIELAQYQCAEALGAAEPLCISYAPRRCYVVGDGPEAVWFADALKKSPRLRLVLPKDIEVTVVSAAMLGGDAYGTPLQAHAPADAMLTLEALFAADRFGRSDVQHFYQ